MTFENNTVKPSKVEIEQRFRDKFTCCAQHMANPLHFLTAAKGRYGSSQGVTIENSTVVPSKVVIEQTFYDKFSCCTQNYSQQK